MVSIYISLRGSSQLRKVFKSACSDHRIQYKSPSKLLVAASLIPKDPVPNQKYQAKAPTNPSKVQDLSITPAFGPKVMFAPPPNQPRLKTNNPNILLPQLINQVPVYEH